MKLVSVKVKPQYYFDMCTIEHKNKEALCHVHPPNKTTTKPKNMAAAEFC